MNSLDHLGHGNSDRPPAEYTLPLFSGQVAALVEKLSLAPVTLIGHCIGAAMSLHSRNRWNISQGITVAARHMN